MVCYVIGRAEWPSKHTFLSPMPSQHPSFNHRTAAASAALPSQEAMQAPRRPRPLSLAIAKLVTQEFFVVVGAAYLASAIYHEAIVREWPSPHVYIAANLFL